jgi:hypothetical protein
MGLGRSSQEKRGGNPKEFRPLTRLEAFWPLVLAEEIGFPRPT